VRAIDRTLVLVFALACPVLGSRTAHADDEDRAASSFFDEGASAYARGDYRAAALAFEEAYRRSPHGATLYDAGVAWEQAKAYDRAADDFALAIDDPALDPKHAVDARRRLASAEKKVGLVAITAPSTAAISAGAIAGGHAPLRVHLPPGAHTIEARFPTGVVLTREVRVAAGTSANVDFATEEPPQSVPGAVPNAVPSAPERAEPPPPEKRPPYAVLGWIGIGAAAGGPVRRASSGRKRFRRATTSIATRPTKTFTIAPKIFAPQRMSPGPLRPYSRLRAACSSCSRRSAVRRHRHPPRRDALRADAYFPSSVMLSR
jgi:hypothetical protein